MTFIFLRGYEWTFKLCRRFSERLSWNDVRQSALRSWFVWNGIILDLPLKIVFSSTFRLDVLGGKLNSKTLCASAQHYNGTHYDLHNLYGYFEAEASNAFVQREKKIVFLFQFDFSVRWKILLENEFSFFHAPRLLVQENLQHIGLATIKQRLMI